MMNRNTKPKATAAKCKMKKRRWPMLAYNSLAVPEFASIVYDFVALPPRFAMQVTSKPPATFRAAMETTDAQR